VNAFLAMYVDDLLILNESVKVINIKALFNSEFKMKDLGEVEYCFGIKIVKRRRIKPLI
jgi:hypothetical protein